MNPASLDQFPVEPNSKVTQPVRWWEAMIWPSLAGGMGWGIRGQYGHETGAMIAGLLVGLTLALLWCGRWRAEMALRAAAFMTIGIGFGGSETYGQTVGLTHDPALVGESAALAWGMLGLAVKGGVWIGFGGLFLGLGLGGVRYRLLEMAAFFAGMMALMFMGTWLFNEPFHPAEKILPRIYFSDDWRWEPGALLKPRRERWGGLLVALAGATVYVGWARRDFLARNLAGWGFLAGAIGFPCGQAVQAFHAWHRGFFQTGFLGKIDPIINWWNLMETTFGAVFGAVLGLGLWLNRSRVREPAVLPDSVPALPWEIGSLVVYAALLVCWEFGEIEWLNALSEPGIPMGLIPVMALVSTRWWPYWVVLPLTLIPIAGKTLRQLADKEHVIEPGWAWLVYVIIPVLCCTALAVRLARADRRSAPAVRTGGMVLVVNVWIYYGLNHAFFRFPAPWNEWTYRTLNDLIYFACAAALSCLALARRRAMSNEQ